jgi:aldehyde dehydrogenase (NAD+)
MAPETSRVIAKILREVFDPREVVVFEGGVDLANALLELPVDHIFFTGSPNVGKTIMTAAAKHLASVTLELGGKCPVVLDEGVDLADVAAKVCRARFFNAGQLCLSTDHVWLRAEQRDAFIEHLKLAIAQMFYKDGQLNKVMLSRIVDARNFDRVVSYIDDATARGAKVALGGRREPDDLTLEPTVLVDVPLDARVMQEEIFGPVLPVLTYRSLDEVIGYIDAGGKPLAMYVYSDNPQFVEKLLTHTSSGGVTVNGVLSHSAERRLPFGGVNHSGMGRYKGIYGFREMSNPRSVLRHPAAGR